VSRHLLNTNTCIAVFRSHPLVLKRMAAVAPGDCAVSTVTSYELYTGVAKCAKPAQERAKVDLLLRTLSELAFEQGLPGKRRGFALSWNLKVNRLDPTISSWPAKHWLCR
jgi:hypothetical protein